MKEIVCYRTSDDVIHTSFRDAKAYAEKRYGDAVTEHAHALARLEKYAAIGDYLDQNRDALALLATLHADTVLDNPNDFEE